MMGFWTVVLAVFTGFWFFKISSAILEVIYERLRDAYYAWEEKQEQSKRTIGFEGAEASKKKKPSREMRKIGFGEHD